MKQPPRSLGSLPPKGDVSSFGTAVRSKMEQPPRSLGSLPPKGDVSSFGTAVRS
uniref:8-amino-7-oxononanoate synthase n=1 Tax=Thiomonas intermedia (strain K12) TaxID=75379 RepID=D5X3R6_THIK1